MLGSTSNKSSGDYLTVAEASEFLGVTPGTLRNWDRSGKLKPSRHPVNGYRLYRRGDLEALFSQVENSGESRATATPTFDWNQLESSEHFVQFYETDSYLVDSVTDYVAAGIRDGESVLLIATLSHVKWVEKKLGERGLDVSSVAQRGQYVALDAAATLSHIMISETPDPRIFREIIGGAVSKLAQQWPAVRAFGEMVALLWAQENRAAARKLEELWNELKQEYQFSLYCAYPLAGFSQERDGVPFRDVCCLHSSVIPAESYTSLKNSADQLRTIAVLQQKSKSLEGQIKLRQQAEGDLNAFLQEAVIGIHQVAADGIILWANAAELNLLGYEATEYIGHHISEFHVDRPVIEDMLGRLQRGETLRDFPAQMRRKDGSIREVQITSNALFEEGHFVHTRCFTRDVTENKAAELALRERERTLRTIFDQTTAGIVQVDLTGRILLANRRFCEITGYSAEELCRKTCAEITHPDDQACNAAMFEKAMHDSQPYLIEKRYVRPDGSTVWVQNSVSVIPNDKGKPQQFLAVSVDVSEKKRAEEQLRLSEQRYSQLLKLLPAAVYLCEAPSGEITYFNDQAAKYWGRTPKLKEPAEHYCGSFKLFLPNGTFLPHAECPMALAVREGRGFSNQEVVVERPDGSRMTALVNIDVIRDANGSAIGAINVFQDITPLKLAQWELAEQKENLETLLETVPVPVFIAHDPECRHISGNRAAAALLRMPTDANFSKTAASNEVPRHFRVLREGQEVPADDLPIQRAARGQMIRAEAVDHVFQDGSVIHTLVSAQPLFDMGGCSRGAIACMLDVTEFANAQMALRETDRRKDEFLATLAHELRNPLAPIRMGLSVLQMTGGSGSAAERVLEMMGRQVAHIVRLIDDLMQLSRVNRGKIELRKEHVPLSTIIHHAIETSRPVIDAAGHRLGVRLPDEPILLHGDPIRLSQVFSNLLNNAAKYTDRGGAISVRAEVDGNSVAVSVADNGIGIPADMLVRVFEMFTQIPNPLRRSQDGLGIGLSLVRALVTMHGGSVTARSDGLGQGSEFVVRLPIEESYNMNMPSKPGKLESSELGVRRVLVADDNRDSADSLAILLKLIGADVHVAYDGATVLESLRIFRPSVAFLDLGMPGMDGYEVARRIRSDQQFRDLVLVALTGWGQDNDLLSTKNVGFNHHLVKPVEFAVIQELLASLPVP